MRLLLVTSYKELSNACSSRTILAYLLLRFAALTSYERNFLLFLSFVCHSRELAILTSVSADGRGEGRHTVKPRQIPALEHHLHKLREKKH